MMAVLAAACASPPSQSDAPVDTSMHADAPPTDARVDGGFDASPDARIDAMTGTPDAMADAMPDASADAMPDGMPDAVPDASADAMPDARADAMLDAAPDAGVTGGIAFSKASYDLGVVPSLLEKSLPPPAIVLRNDSSSTQSITFQTTGPIKISPLSCESIAPMSSCTLLLSVRPSSTGPFTASIHASSAAGSADTQIVGSAESLVVGELDGTGSGTISAQPAGDACNGQCYQPGTSVTFTVTPATGSHIAAWTEPSCGTSPTCTVVAIDDPTYVRATVQLDRVSFSVEILGNGYGEVVIDDLSETFVCSASCTVSVPYGDLWVYASTPATISGWSAPCQTASDACGVPAGTSSVSVTFTTDPDEQDLFFDGDVYSVDYDDAGELVVGTSTGVTKLSAALAPLWTVAIPGEARVDHDGNVFVWSTDGLHALDADGNPRWTAGTGTTVTFPHSGHTIVTTPSGGVVLDRGGSLEIRDANGGLVASPALSAYDNHALAVRSNGDILAAVEDPDADDTDAETFAADGTQLAGPVKVVGGYACAFAVDADDAFVASGTGHTRLWVHRLDASGTQTFYDVTVTPDADYMFNAVATDGVGNVWSLRASNETTDPSSGFLLRALSPAGTLLSSRERPGSQGRFGPIGNAIFDLAVSSSGRAAIGGVYHGYYFSKRGLVIVFE
jgi:hypothetical protein